MWQSVKGGHLALVKRLAKMFPESVNTSENSSGNTPLSESLIYTVWDGIAEEITEDRIEMVRLLIESGADLNPMIPEGEFSPLSKAAMNGSVSLFEFFIQKGARVSTTESALRPLEEAASTGQAKLTDFLLDQLDVETALLGNRHDLAIILLAAATRGNEAIVQRILEKSRYQVAKLHPLKVHLLCSPGPLTSAARWGHVGTMKLLLKHGAYPNREPEETNPLFAACIGGHIQAVQVLISHGVDLSIKGDDGRSPLIPAIKFPPLFELLLDAGMPGESNCIDSFNVYRSGEIETPMGAAVKSGNVALVEKMKSLKVNWNLTKPPRPWITVLKQAAGGGVQMLKLVHRYGFVANPGEDEAEVAFQIAIGEGDLKAIAFFLERGFDPNPKDNPTRTFSHLELAVIAEVSKEKKGTIDLLLRHGAGVHNLRGFSYPFCKPSGGLQPEEAYLRFYRILLELGANPLPETQFGSFSWAMAAERNQKKVSRLFLQYIEKRNISIADLQHNMALIEAMPVVMDNRHIMKSWKKFYWRKVYPVPS
ncbi:uncharacterized protein N7529_004708 [Penicillium soppii]|uniref:uncharacterized protein n=1 Tax=Penicillium soppii TaxID=69789 RepID=UPI002547F475|nr:uncharacterized protein N7529_004708 [Penicillium soppii]KAJ5872355.1 hypothetical protein N7529_004708 [Penicillium soppii]